MDRDTIQLPEQLLTKTNDGQLRRKQLLSPEHLSMRIHREKRRKDRGEVEKRPYVELDIGEGW